MRGAKEWLRKKTELMTSFVQRFACTASRTRATPADTSRKEAIYRIQQMDLAIDMLEGGGVKNKKEAAISAVTCTARAAMLADLANLDIEALEMLMDSIASRDFPVAAIHLERFMDSAGFAGGFDEYEDKVIRLCEERQRRGQVFLD